MDAPRSSEAGLRGPREAVGQGRGRRRSRTLRALVASCVALVTSAVLVTSAGASHGSVADAAAAPSCNIKGALYGLLVPNVSAGQSINIDCKNFPANHPYLLVEASLLVAIDPAASPLLTGQATSVPGLLGIIAASPLLNAQSVAFPTSNSSGVINYNYTVPSSQPLDPNATCPPTTEEINSGLIGCAVAMIDLESFQPVVAGTFVLEWKGDPLLPPDPTLKLSNPSGAMTGQRVGVSDVPGAKTFWWLATLESIEAGLGGGGGTSGPIPVVVKNGRKKLVSTAAVTPASYNGTTFTPPALSGYFLAPARGKHTIKVSLTADLLGIDFTIQQSAKEKVIP